MKYIRTYELFGTELFKKKKEKNLSKKAPVEIIKFRNFLLEYLKKCFPLYSFSMETEFFIVRRITRFFVETDKIEDYAPFTFIELIYEEDDDTALFNFYEKNDINFKPFISFFTDIASKYFISKFNEDMKLYDLNNLMQDLENNFGDFLMRKEMGKYNL